MEFPNEILEQVFRYIWDNQPFCTEQIQFFTSAVLVNSQWRDQAAYIASENVYIFNKMHAKYVLMLIHNSGPSVVYRQGFSRCRSLTFTIEHPAMIANEEFVETALTTGLSSHMRSALPRQLFLASLTGKELPQLRHLYIDHIDDAGVSSLTYPIPPQVTHLYIRYYFRPTITPSVRVKMLNTLGRFHPHVNIANVRHLTMLGRPQLDLARCLRKHPPHLESFTTDHGVDLAHDLNLKLKLFTAPAPLCDAPFEHPTFPFELACGKRVYETRLQAFYRGRLFHHPWWNDVPLWDQHVKPGAVGYLNKHTGKFIKFFNVRALHLAQDARVRVLPPLSDAGLIAKETKMDVKAKGVKKSWGSRSTWKRMKVKLSRGEEAETQVSAKFNTSNRRPRMDIGSATQSLLSTKGKGQLNARQWMNDHWKVIKSVYGVGRYEDIEQEDMILVTKTIDSTEYGLFIPCPRDDEKVDSFELHIYTSPADGQPRGEYRLAALSESAGSSALWWSRVSTAGSQSRTIFIGGTDGIDRNPDVLVQTLY